MLNDRDGLIHYQTIFASLAESDEPREGMLAFMEKRPPRLVPAGLWLEGGGTR
jgi:enoyl-CoA hydratase